MIRPAHRSLDQALTDIQARLAAIESALHGLTIRQPRQDHYSVAEFARIVERAEFTVREWCRLGRLHATRKASGRGPYRAWVISHAELLRFQRDGLLPLAISPTVLSHES